MDLLQTIALSAGAGWASGINLYAATFVLGILGRIGSVDLPPNLEILTHPAVLFTAAVMYLVEFFVDKFPGLDSVWDAIHTFIRIPIGAVLAANATGNMHTMDPGVLFAMGLIGGGTLAASSHFAKASTRVAINTSPEPFSNWAASITEDFVVVAGLWAAVHYPFIFLGLLVLFLALLAWLVPKIIRGLRAAVRAVRLFLGAGTTVIPPERR